MYLKKKKHKSNRLLCNQEKISNELQKSTFDLASKVVERSYPKEDVATLRTFKKKYGDPCDVVAKDKCFYFAHQEDVNDEGEKEETKSHFDFGLYGNHNGQEHYGSDDSDHFAHAYFREELKAKGCNPDIIAQQSGKDSNPHKTKHIDMCNKALGKDSSSRYSDDDNTVGLTKDFNAPYYADVIGTSYCRSRAIACTKDEYNIFLMWRSAKAKVVSTHQTWINSIMKQCDQLKIGLKAYRYLSEGIELASEPRNKS